MTLNVTWQLWKLFIATARWLLACWICSALVGKDHTGNPGKLFDVAFSGVSLIMCEIFRCSLFHFLHRSRSTTFRLRSFAFSVPVTWIIDCLSTFAALSFFTTVFLSLWLRSPLLDVSKGVFLMIFFIICLIILLTPSHCFLYQTWDCRSREGKTSTYVLLEKLNWTSWTTSGDHSGQNCEIVLSPPSLDVL